MSYEGVSSKSCSRPYATGRRANSRTAPLTPLLHIRTASEKEPEDQAYICFALLPQSRIQPNFVVISNLSQRFGGSN